MKWNRQGWSQNSVKHQRKQPTALITCWLFQQKGCTADLPLDCKCRSDWRSCERGVWVDCHAWNHSCRLVRNKVVKVGWNYKKSYFWWPGNPACGDLTGSNRIGKDQGCISARLVWGTGREGAMWLTAHGVPSDHWANSDYVDVLLTCGERGLDSFGELVLFQGMDVKFRGKK